MRARPDKFRRGRKLEPIFQEMGVDGVFSAEGEAWLPQRKLAVRALSHRNLKGFYPVLHTMANRLLSRWCKAADTGQVLDIQAELMRFTVDVTTMLAFGHDLNSLGDSDDKLQRHLDPIFPLLAYRLFAIFPYWRVLRMPRDRQLDASLAALREWLSAIISKTRARLEANPDLSENPENFLQSMLSSKDENGNHFSDERIFGNSMTMLLAGEDTTANSLAWAVHHLLDSPDALIPLLAELDEKLGRSHVPDDIATADSLRYATCVANETMRLRPVAPILVNECNEPTTIGNVAVDEDSTIVLLLRPAANDDKNVPDSKSVTPSRWLDPAAPGAVQQRQVHMPFGSGPRICPGRSLAFVEMNIVLATLYKNFRVERVGESADVTEEFSFTMIPRGLRVRLSHR